MKKHKILKTMLFYFSVFAITVLVASTGYYISYQKEAAQTKTQKKTVQKTSVAPQISLVTPKKADAQEERSSKKEPENTQRTNDSTVETMAEKVHYKMPSLGRIVSGYNDTKLEYSELFGDWRTHPSIDFDTSLDRDVWAAAEGTISKIYQHPVYGKTVIIDHGNNIRTTYAPIQVLTTLKEGTKVLAGDIIGSCLPNGKESVLHFEAFDEEKPFNPF